MRQSDADARARAFVRVPVLRRLPTWKVALEAGLGVDLRTTRQAAAPLDHAPRATLGLAVGRPLVTPLGDGWASAELRLDRRLSGAVGPPSRTILGVTVGARPRAGHAVEIGLHLEAEAGGETYGAFGPAWQRDLGRFGSGRLGVIVTERGEARLRLGFVRTFGKAR